ncbi:MAG: Ig-like domain-containing protein [Lachnospiraceae bacterium]|nr:Ig-like domain-containing protein [Lachnospiraceae bacterium]
MRKKVLSVMLAIAMAGATFSGSGTTAYAGDSEVVKVIDVPGTAESGAGYISVNEEITTASGKRRVILNGLKEGNKEAMVKAIEANYNESEDTTLKFVNKALPDAEKWDADALPENEYDSKFCWAATISNMLWTSGWAEKMKSPDTGKNFTSEDELFTFFSGRFANGGGDIRVGIDWFFDGIYYFPSIGSDAQILYPDDKTNGVLRKFYVHNVTELFKVNRDLSLIKEIERIDMNSDKPAVFYAGICDLPDIEDYDGGSGHAVTAVGAVIDPDATAVEDRYKAIIIADSDNDGSLTASEKKMKNPSVDQKLEGKIARPNSYTICYLDVYKDKFGKKHWRLKHYLTKGGEVCLDALVAMPYYDQKIIDANIETEGTTNPFKNVDLAVENVITSDLEEAPSLIMKKKNEVMKDSFGADEKINMHYYISNRSSVELTKKYTGGKKIRVDWKLVNDKTGKVVSKGTDYQKPDIYLLLENGYSKVLNEKNGKFSKLAPGSYTVSVKVNAKKTIKEAYYLNNTETTFSFKVTKTKATLNKKSVSLKAGKSAKLKIKNGTVVKWSSSNDKIVTVKDGKVKGVKKGTAKVTATLYSGRKLTCKVTVK